MRRLCALALVLVPATASAQEVEGAMQCRITDFSIVASRDGRGTTYEAIEDVRATGDTLWLRYKAYRSSFETLLLDLELRDDDRGFLVANTHSLRMVPYLADKSGLMVRSGFASWDRFGPNEIAMDVGEGFVRFSRYYKNDWHGVAAFATKGQDGYTLSAQAFSLDCRHTEDRLDEALSLLWSEWSDWK